MTVKELIEELQKHPPDMEVCTVDEWGHQEIFSVEIKPTYYSAFTPTLNDPTPILVLS